MCYDERLFRSWTTKKAQKREQDPRGTEQERPEENPIPVAVRPEVKRRPEVESELDEVV